MPRNTVSFIKKIQDDYEFQQVFINGKYFGDLMPYWIGNKKHYEFSHAINVEIDVPEFPTMQEAKKFFQAIEF